MFGEKFFLADSKDGFIGLKDFQLTIKLSDFFCFRVGYRALHNRVVVQSFIAFNVVNFSNRRVAAQKRIHHFFLDRDFFPHVGVVSVFGHVGENLDFGVFVAGTQDSTFALFNVTRSPRTIQMMSRNQMFLDVDAHAHFCRRADDESNFGGVDFVEQCLTLFRVFGVVHEGDLIGGNAALNQTLLYSVVNCGLVGGRCFVVKVVFVVGVVVFFGLRNAQVSKNYLRALNVCSLVIFRRRRVAKSVNFRARLSFGQFRVNQPHVKRGLAQVVGYLQEVVVVRVDAAVMNCRGAVLHVKQKLFVRFRHWNFNNRARVVFEIRAFQVRQIFGHFDVGEFTVRGD